MFLAEDIFSSYKNKSEAWILKKNPGLHSFIFSVISLPISWRQKFYLYYNGLTTPTKCYCGNTTDFIGISKGYRKYCSKKCKALDPDLLAETKARNLEKWGVDNPMKSEQIKARLKASLQQVYGVENISKLDIVKEKVKARNQQRHGVDYLSQLKTNREILAKKMVLKSADLNRSKKKVLEKNLGARFQKHNLEFIEIVSTSVYKARCAEAHEFMIHKTMLNDRIRNRNTICTICNRVYSGSDAEEQLYDFIKSIYSGTIIRNYRCKFEIDIYLPDLNIGFEYNGIYWHSAVYRDKHYHANKLDYFLEKGIHLFYIWEDDWIGSHDLVKNIISMILPNSSYDQVEIGTDCSLFGQNKASRSITIDDSIIYYEDLGDRLIITGIFGNASKQIIERFVSLNQGKSILFYIANELYGYLFKKAGFKHCGVSNQTVSFITDAKRVCLKPVNDVSLRATGKSVHFIWNSRIELLIYH